MRAPSKTSALALAALPALLACNLFTQIDAPLSELEDAGLDPGADLGGADMTVALDMPQDMPRQDMPQDMPQDAPQDLPDAALPPEDIAPDLIEEPASTSASRLTPVPARTHANRLDYYQYLPATPPQPRTAPLIIFLHDESSAGAAGLSSLLTQPLLARIAADRWPDALPFVVLAPRQPEGRCMTPLMLADFIGFALNHYPALDPGRVHVVGLGCGATAGWDYLASSYDNPITSATLIGGDGRAAASAVGCDLRRAAIWAVAGEQDAAPAGTSAPLAQLAACPLPDLPPLRGGVAAAQTSAQLAAEIAALRAPMMPEPTLDLWLAGLSSVVATPPAGFPVSLRFDQRALIDLGTSDRRTADPAWNNLGNCERLNERLSLADAASAPTLSALRVADPFNDTATNGTSDAAASGYPASATSDGCWSGAFNVQDARDARATLVVEGLEPLARYDLSIYGSRIREQPNDMIGRVGLYEAGAESGTFDATDNVAGRLVLADVQADSSGAINLRLRVAQGNNQFAYLSALEIISR